MCSSWLPSVSKSQESSFEISSIVRSLTANRPRLPGPITFRDEQGKSLCDIVSRLSLTIDEKSTKSLKEKSLDFFNKKNHEVENSRVEAATIDGISSPALRRRERVNLMISQALWNTEETELVELYSGERGEVEGGNLGSESVDKLKTWGSIKSFASRGDDDFTGAFSRSTVSQDQRTDITEKLSKENLSLEQTSPSLSSTNLGLESVPQLLENPLQDRKNLLTKIDVIEAPKPIVPEPKEDLKDSSSSRISLSLKNSRDKMKKKSGTRFSKRKSSHRMRGKRGKKLSSSTISDKNETKPKSAEKPEEKLQNSLEAANSDKNATVAAKLVDPTSFPAETSEPKRREDLHEESQWLLQKPQKSKLELLKSRFASGLFLQQNATAKPSRTVIPQSSRARAIFRPLAGIQEPEDPKPKDSRKPPMEPPKPKNRTTPIPRLSNPAWRPGGSPPGRAPSSRSPSAKPPKKTSGPKETAQSPILRSRTFISKDPKTEEGSFKKEADSPKGPKKGAESPKSSKKEADSQKSFKKDTDSQKSFKKEADFQKSLKNHADSSKTSKKEADSQKRPKNLEPLRILKEILSIKEESSKPSKIPTIRSSQTQNSPKSSKTLIEKLAKSSDTSIPSVPSIPSIRLKNIGKKLYRTSQDLQTQTPKIAERSRSLQTVPESHHLAELEQFHVFTETESKNPVMIDAQVSCDPQEKERKDLMDAGVSCSLSSASFLSKKVELKVFRVIQTQTSKSLLIWGGKKDVSLETLRINFPCKEINTDKNVLIDSATGKDKLEISNFSCDSKLTNTNELILYPGINSVVIDEKKVDSIQSIVNIDFSDNSINSIKSIKSMNSIVSSISNELVSSKKCLIDSCKKFSSEILQKHEEIIRIPEEVIRAFEIAANRAQNLYRAIEIYHEKILNSREINCDLQNLRKIEDFDKSCGHDCSDFEGLMMQQEVQIFIEDIMNAVDEKLNDLNNDVLINCDYKSKKSTKLLMKRGNILPIVYGALCSLVFWSLQFSMSCDLS